MAEKQDHLKLRNVAGAFPTGIAVVSLLDRNGEVRGMTINSFLSVSLDPPLILFAASTESGFVELCSIGSELSFNILSEDQKSISDQFAGIETEKNTAIFSHEDKFMKLEGASAWYKTKVRDLISAGDHVLVICDIIDCSRNSDKNPILFHSGYRKIGDLLD